MRKQTVVIEKNIPASTLASAPVRVDLGNIGGRFLDGIYIYSTSLATLGKVYMRITSKNGVVFPGASSQPISTAVPAGWCSLVDKAYHDVHLPISGPDFALTAEFINVDTGGYDVYAHLIVTDGDNELDHLAAIEKLVREIVDHANKRAG